MKLLITDHPWPGTEIERKILEPYSVEIIDAPAEDEETLSRLAKDVDAIACCWAEVTAAVIQAARNCRVICRMGIGLDNIDITAATENGILVTNIPDYCVEEVADHAMGLLLALVQILHCTKPWTLCCRGGGGRRIAIAARWHGRAALRLLR